MNKRAYTQTKSICQSACNFINKQVKKTKRTGIMYATALSNIYEQEQLINWFSIQISVHLFIMSWVCGGQTLGVSTSAADIRRYHHFPPCHEILRLLLLSFRISYWSSIVHSHTEGIKKSKNTRSIYGQWHLSNFMSTTSTLTQTLLCWYRKTTPYHRLMNFRRPIVNKVPLDIYVRSSS